MWNVSWNSFSFDSYVTSTIRVSYKNTYTTCFTIICYSCTKTTKNYNKLKLLIKFHGNGFTNISSDNLNFSSNIWSDGQTAGILIGFRRFAFTCKIISYVHQCCLGNRNKLPSCQDSFLVSHTNDETETAYKRDRRSDPLAAPRRVSHTLSLKQKKLNKQLRFPYFYSEIFKKKLHINLTLEHNCTNPLTPNDL
jgi:hypothetical protein